jgi:3-deoxy-7-phosphoheptulonate synthase
MILPPFMKTQDLRIKSIKPLISPALLLEELPLTDALAAQIRNQRQQVADIIHGRDSRLLVIVGPCSIHDPQAALEYADRLAQIAKKLSAKLMIVMRVYFEKPRTTVGWKGLINDPHLDDSCNINQGLRIARRLLLDIATKGLPIAVEFLDTISPQYVADLVSWGAIGARTTESQVHRELASGLSMPIGFKNATSGDIDIALDAVKAASHPHSFLGVTSQGLSAIVMTAGNPDAHIVLRGGKSGPNYDLSSLQAITQAQAARHVKTGIIIDASHANSQKDYRRQLDVLTSIRATLASHSELPIAGVMIESHLNEGRQDLKPGRPLTYGQSITDACLGWDQTEDALNHLGA